MKTLDGSSPVTLYVNGQPRCGQAEPRLHLGDFLRNELGLTGTHLGCEHGVCGACTVLVDGVSSRSCLMLAVQAEGAQVRTVEGLAQEDGPLSMLQQAFHDNHGLQCGYCTPGILMSLTELLETHPAPDEAVIRDVLSGHLCRCTGYQNIVAAALKAVQAFNAAKGREAV
jgi:aerobic-type carbon monoxide dehydrogenase small subunit (CoxS/CutS family)